MRTRLLSVFMMATTLLACSDDGGGTSGAGGGSTTSASSMSSWGFVPPTPDGAFFLALVQDDPISCLVSGHTASVGKLDDMHRTMVVTDGMGSTAVDCVVSGTSSFEVHGKVDDTAKSGNFAEIVIPSITPGASESAPAAGSIAFSAPWTAGEPYSGACSFYFSASPPETVGTGKVWVTFACPAVTAGMSTCPIKLGYAIFENCLAQ